MTLPATPLRKEGSAAKRESMVIANSNAFRDQAGKLQDSNLASL